MNASRAFASNIAGGMSSYVFRMSGKEPVWPAAEYAPGMPTGLSPMNQRSTPSTRRTCGTCSPHRLATRLVQTSAGSVMWVSMSTTRYRSNRAAMGAPSERRPPYQSRPAPAGTGRFASFARVRLLLLEDDQETADALAQGLARDGHEVVRAGDVAGALARIAERSFDAAVLDLMVPG